MKIDEDAIRKLAELLDETDLTEIEVAEGEQSIRVSRNGGNMIAAGYPVAGGVAPVATATAADNDAPVEITKDHPGAVVSPMVGTAYLQPEPDAPSFVSSGDQIQEGDTLLIIEAMKVMNPVKAHKSGVVRMISVENGHPVEFGDILMVIE